MSLRGNAFALAATLLLGFLPAACAQAAATTLCKSQTLAVAGGSYIIQNNEWGSSALQCITTGRNASFTVTKSALAKHRRPGGYPSIYKGCHWGACTRDSGLPIQVSRIHAGTVTTSWRTAQPGGSSVYNVAYDIWFNQTPAANGQPTGAELMIWLNHHGPVRPGGFQIARDVSIGGRSYHVWLSNRGGWQDITYEMTSGTASVRNLDLQALVADAVSRGCIQDSWYLIDVEAGFELWRGGVGLAALSFSVDVAGADRA